jgi:hypothetical protein
MEPAARDAYDDTLRQAIDAGDSAMPDAKLAGAVAACIDEIVSRERKKTAAKSL